MVSGNLIESSSYRIFSCCNCSKPQRMHQRPSGLAPFCPRCSARLNSNKSPGQFFSVSTRRLSRKIGKILKKNTCFKNSLGNNASHFVDAYVPTGSPTEPDSNRFRCTLGKGCLTCLALQVANWEKNLDCWTMLMYNSFMNLLGIWYIKGVLLLFHPPSLSSFMIFSSGP